MPDDQAAAYEPIPVTIVNESRAEPTTVAVILAVMELRAHGEFVQVANFGTQYVNAGSTVLANICEMGEPPNVYPFIGGARMQVCNIAPKDDGTVALWLKVDWGSDLDLRVRFVVF